MPRRGAGTIGLAWAAQFTKPAREHLRRASAMTPGKSATAPAAEDRPAPEKTPAARSRICIATGRYLRPGETFVNRHVEHLFGGNTMVVCGRRTGRDRLGKPVFSRLRAFLNPRDVLTAPWHLLQNHRAYRSPLVSFGNGRAGLVSFLEREGAQAVLAEFGSQAVTIWPVVRAMGLPLFVYFRGRDASRHLRSPYRVEAYRRMLPELAGIFAVSGFLLDNLAAQGLSHPNAHVVPSGTDTGYFRPGPKAPGSMLFVGRFVEKKAPRLALESFLELAGKHPHARLDFVGDGPQLAACRKRAAAARHGDRVTFHGRQSHAQVRDHLARAEIFVLHSITGRDGETEGLPSAIQEAMASGAAILSSRHAGIPELVAPGVSGWLVAEQDATGLVAAMDRMLAQPEETRRMGQNARAVAEERVEFRTLYRHVETVIAQAVDSQTAAPRPPTPRTAAP